MINLKNKHDTLSIKIKSCMALIASVFTPVVFAKATQNWTFIYHYDAMGNLNQIAHPLNQVSKLAYNPLNRIKQFIHAAPIAEVPRPTIAKSYDGADLVMSILDPRSLTTSYVNYGLGNRGKITSPDVGISNGTFDEAGNLLTISDAHGKDTTHGYDALDRITSIYDALNNLQTQTGGVQ